MGGPGRFFSNYKSREGGEWLRAGSKEICSGYLSGVL